MHASQKPRKSDDKRKARRERMLTALPTQEEIDRWAEARVREDYEYYKAHDLDFLFEGSGVKTFFSPVKYSPKILTLSFNPGGGKQAYESDRIAHERREYASTIPRINEYLDPRIHYVMKSRVLALLGPDADRILRDSLEMTVFPFRTKDKLMLTCLPSIFGPIERYSLPRIKQATDFLNPSKLLIIGFDTLAELKKEEALGSKDFHEESAPILGARGRRLAVRFKWKEKKIFTVIHLSGAILSSEDFRLAQMEFSKWWL